MEHQAGQRRAELFDVFVGRLLAAMYSGVTIVRNVALADPEKNQPYRSISVDFLVAASERGEPDVVIETKAPYTGGNTVAVKNALRQIVTVISRAESVGHPLRAVLAISDRLPRASALDVEQASVQLALRNVALEIWDAERLRELSRGYLDFDPLHFELAVLERFVGEQQPGAAASLVERRLPIGKHDDVIVLSADFCSFSRFVQASGSDSDLVTSVMGRFYRETRAAISEHEGVLDKYMGDGILAYWLSGKAPALFERCVQRLVGIALNLAEEWQDHIDLAVEPRGLRAGGAVGAVLFIAERPADPDGPVHAIGDSINISARLQSEAQPNCLVISNRLRTRHFGARADFEELGARSLKNIGDVIAWSKAFGQDPGA